MPVRQRNIRRRKTLRLADLDISAILDFEVGWQTPEERWEVMIAQCPEWDTPSNRERALTAHSERDLWTTREEYLSDYDSVRDELMARWSDIADWAAEKLWQRQWGNR